MSEPPAPAHSPPPSDPVADELEKQRRKLLDLTRRNRLLNFRPTRRTTVGIVDEIPSELYRLLALEGKTLSFLPGTPRPTPPAPLPVPRPAPVPEPTPTSESAPDPEPRPADLKGKGKGVARALAPTPSVTSASELGIEFAQPRGRCPFCHDDVSPQEETAVCNSCLSRMHAECWDEAGRCSSCGGGHALRAATAAPPPVLTPTPPLEESRTYRRVPREKLPERHTDHALQTDLPAGDLEANLLSISRRAATTFEEQGFNALYLALGFLEWTERGSKEPQRAPVLLVPVELKRRTVRSAFKITIGDDDPLVNPALAFKLTQDWDVELPSLPDDAREADPDDVLEALAARVAQIPGWRVTDEAALALFSFNKFVMYKDLELHQAHVLAHPVVRRLLSAEPSPPAPDSVTPVRARLVLEADATQRDAIDTVLAGESLVLEGPPGTGKSQTIANLIASFLAAGKSVLFVSEKMAALEVVQSRLEDVGLGAFCLELHSRHANKRAVVRNLERTLSLDLPADHNEDETLRELAGLDESLDALVSELHSPWGPLAHTPFQVLGQLEKQTPPGSDPAGFISALAGSESWTATDLHAHQRALETLGTHLAATGSPRVHPCRGVQLAESRHSSRGEIQDALTPLRTEALPRLQDAVAALAQAAVGREPQTLSEIDQVLEWAELLCDPHLPEAAVLGNPAWDGQPPEAESLIELYARRQILSGQLKAKLKEPLPPKDELVRLAVGVEAQFSSWYRVFVPSYWTLRGEVREVCAEGHDPAPELLVRDLTLGAQAAGLDSRLKALNATGSALFGKAWPGPRADLERVGRLARAYRTQLRAGRLTPGTLERHVSGRLERSRLLELRQAVVDRLEAFQLAWAGFQAATQFDGPSGLGQALSECAWDALAGRLAELDAGLDGLAGWVELRRSLANAERAGLTAFVERSLDAELAPELLAPVLERAFHMRVLDRVLEERRRLATFDAVAHEGQLESFRSLDARKLRLDRVRLRHELAARRPDTSWAASEGSELGILQRELRRKRGHLPVRQLLRKIPTAIRALKPCLLMSPLTVAQFTEPALHTFDLVIFDEASQIAPEDALGAVARGRQVVVVGDSKQMPPTSFFKAQVASDPGEVDLQPDLESVLDECVAQALPRRVLRWHYRSRHESLIAFSNRAFYEGRLHTFPSPDDGQGALGLSSVRVEGAVYERGGSGRNTVEAEAVADAVLQHFLRTPERSLGVGTFSQAQQEAILDAVERRARQERWLEPLLSPDRDEHFFVKNLENLQGDERDVILVSVGYGPDAEGKLSLNFGPLNQTGGERRLNVLITRARQRLVVYTSFEASQLDLSRSQSHGLKLLKDYLAYTESQVLPEVQGSRDEVLAPQGVVLGLQAALEAEGLTVRRDVGASSVRVNLTVEEDGRAILGILVDGPRYAALPSVRDRERLLPAVLRGLRWRIARVWSLEWHRHPQRVLASLLDAVAAAREASAEEAAALAAAADAAAKQAEEAIRLKAPAAEAGDEASVPYTECPVAVQGPPEAFADLDLADVAAVLEQVVRAEGPIHRDEAQRRTLAHWELSRSRKTARTKVDAAAAHATKAGAVYAKGEFLWPRDLEQPQVRDRSQGGPRDVELIPPEEIRAALLLVAGKELRIASLDLIKRAAKLLGFPRAGKKLQAGLRAILDALVTAGELREENAVITVGEE